MKTKLFVFALLVLTGTFAQAAGETIVCNEKIVEVEDANAFYGFRYAPAGKFVKFKNEGNKWRMHRGVVGKEEGGFNPGTRLESCKAEYFVGESMPPHYFLKSLNCADDSREVDGPLLQILLVPAKSGFVMTINEEANVFGEIRKRTIVTNFEHCTLEVNN